MSELMKSFGAFNQIGDVVQINLPGGAEGVALRLYQEGLEVAIWAIVPTDHPSAPATSRFFMLTDSNVIPSNFVKFVGALLFGPSKTPCIVIEVTGESAPATIQSRLVPAI